MTQDETVGPYRDGSAERRADPLLIAAQVLLYVLLAGLILAAVVTVIGIAAQSVSAPWGRVIWDPAWRPFTSLLFALGALWIVADTVVNLLAMIRSVERGVAFERANVKRIERIAHNTIGLAVLGVVASLLGIRIEGNVNGFDIGVDLPASIGFALLLFILARVFRQGAAMREDLEGTV